MADAYMGWDVPYAVRMICMLEDAGLDLKWVEEPVIPHAGQFHNYHLVMAHLNSPMAEYSPPPEGGGALDDDTLFWRLFGGEPRAEGGFVALPDAAGFGWRLEEEVVRGWSVR